MEKRFKRVPAEVPVSNLTPLNISCGSTKCEEGLHCFSRYQNVAKKKYGKTHACYECGVSLKSSERLQKRNIKDSDFVFNELKTELIRHVYWHMQIKDTDKLKALNDGIEQIEADAIDRMTNVIGIEEPFRQGITPYFGNIIYYGQHATACCCRICMEFWHGIPTGRKLTKDEIEYFVQLIMAYVNDRIPELKIRKPYKKVIKIEKLGTNNDKQIVYL